ncbi:MAG: tripartite tricarboxylate transporter substrate binding protein [Betaproteobacteria bacterium]|nr:tripartite tricarboxylate transporter substrate binding protein [Betaproteobacteria bacterium]
MKILTPLAAAACIATATGLSSATASGQAYPNKPIRFFVGYAAGGAADVVTRLIAPRLAETFGQPVVVDNRPGAGSMIATGLLAQARPDGYTIMMANVSFGANSALHRKLSYDALKDIVSVAHVDVIPNALLVPLTLPVRSAGELIALAKSKPGTLNHAHAGIGSAGYLIAESVKFNTGINVVHIPYQSGPQALAAVIGGEAQLGFVTIPSALSLVKAGRVRALAVTSLKRAATLPDVPTIAESVLPGFEVNEWHGVLAPAGTPKAVIAALNREINAALMVPAVRERLSSLGAEATGGTPETMAGFVKTEIERWKKVLKPVD